MALNLARAKETKADKLLKGNEFPKEAKTSTDVILSELVNLEKEDTVKEEIIPKSNKIVAPAPEVSKQETTSPKKSSKQNSNYSKVKSGKVGRKKLYDEPRLLIHVKVTDDLKKRIDVACEARNMTMQSYIAKLIENDLKTNETKYVSFLESKNFD